VLANAACCSCCRLLCLFFLQLTCSFGELLSAAFCELLFLLLLMYLADHCFGSAFWTFLQQPPQRWLLAGNRLPVPVVAYCLLPAAFARLTRMLACLLNAAVAVATGAGVDTDDGGVDTVKFQISAAVTRMIRQAAASAYQAVAPASGRRRQTAVRVATRKRPPGNGRRVAFSPPKRRDFSRAGPRR
jgi:hypothetical protein